MKKKKILNFTEEFILFLKDYIQDELSQSSVFLDSPFWEATKIEQKKIEQQRKEKQKYYNTINRLVKYKYLIKEKKNDKINLKFTNKGLIKLQKILWKTNESKKKLPANELCLVFFDVPEKQRHIRDLFRKCLYELGFSKTQRSVFITRNNVIKEIKTLIKNCELEKYVQVMLAKNA